MSSDGAAPGKKRSALVRWATILLPIVFGLRAILLVFQLRSEHHRPLAAPKPPAWPPHAGEVLAFTAGAPGIAAWQARPDHASLPASLIERDFATMPPNTACMLDPAAMARGGGSLELASRNADGYWAAKWTGSSTLPASDVIASGDSRGDQIQAAMLAAAECGANARIELSEQVVHVLVNILSGLPPPPPGPEMPNREIRFGITPSAE